ncbi:MAG: hypothetical protein KAR83_05745 [Thermodesulfovibrionales bacterium]|nr:hypothetical protein [Thermodesulfovibrionales bacterium]
MVKDYEVWKNTANARVFRSFARRVGLTQPSVPVTVVGDSVIGGFSEASAIMIEEKVREAFEAAARGTKSPSAPSTEVKPSAGPSSGPGPVAPPDEEKTPVLEQDRAPELTVSESEPDLKLPFLGEVSAEGLSLPVFTLVLAGLDSFNPCALFVLMFLLSLLIYAKSRVRMLIIGGTFVFFSGFVYFLFMAAWLNLFFLAGRVGYITAVAGAVALFVGVLNVKDFFAFKEGVSLTMSDGAQGRLIARMRGLLKAESMVSMLTGTVVLAVAANAYELLCTAGFPMVYTRVLTLRELGTGTYYMYLVLYNLVYVVPLAAMVLVFTFTLGSRKLTEWEGRLLKLLSGSMMLMLGSVLLLKPTLLDNIFIAAGMLAGAVALTLGLSFIYKRWENKGKKG